MKFLNDEKEYLCGFCPNGFEIYFWGTTKKVNDFILQNKIDLVCSTDKQKCKELGIFVG